MPLLAIALLGCGGKNTEPTPSTENKDGEAPSEQPAPKPAEQVVVTTAGGSRAAPRSSWAPAATAFALDLHRGTEAGNTAVSGVSAYVALSMLAEGSQGSTRESFAAALGGPLDKAFHIDNERALAAFNDTAGVKLSSASAVWADSGVELGGPFTEAVGVHYGAAPSPLTFSSDPAAATRVANSWVKDHTAGMIEELFTEGDLRGATFVLANAVAFEGEWLTPFDPADTTDKPFAAPTGEVTVPTLSANNEAFGYLDGDGFEAVVLPYQGSMSSLVLLLPDADSDLASLEKALSAESLKAAAMVRGRRPLNLTLPKFKLEVEHDLKEVLGSTALSSALASGDYGGIAPGIVVDPAKQKVFFEVDEQGTKAAAATGIVGTRSVPPPPIDVHFDRPFVFALWHVETGVPLFTGRVVDPS